MIFCSSCLRVSPPIDRSEKQVEIEQQQVEQQVEIEEEMGIENDKENGNEEVDKLIKKGKGVSNNNENGNDETALGTSEHIELLVTSTAKNLDD